MKMKSALAIFFGLLVVAGSILVKDPATQFINDYLGVPTFLGCNQDHCLFLHGNGRVVGGATSYQFLGITEGALVSIGGTEVNFITPRIKR